MNMSCSAGWVSNIFHAYLLFGHISSAFKLAGGPRGNITLHFPSCGVQCLRLKSKPPHEYYTPLWRCYTERKRSQILCCCLQRKCEVTTLSSWHTRGGTIGFHYANSNSRAKIIDTNTYWYLFSPRIRLLCWTELFFWAWIRICLSSHFFIIWWN